MLNIDLAGPIFSTRYKAEPVQSPVFGIRL